jgi:hypothetical protein
VKHQIGYDERWPEFDLGTPLNETPDPDDKYIELTDEELQDFIRVRKQWFDWQQRFRDAYGWEDL